MQSQKTKNNDYNRLINITADFSEVFKANGWSSEAIAESSRFI